MWESDVGRAKGSSLQILKTIFEINLKLFSQKSAKKIVFLVRDFDFEDYGQEGYYHMKKSIEDRLEELWRSISKPKKYENSSFKKFFFFRFQTLPSIKDKSAFRRGVEFLQAQLFDPDSEDYLLDELESKVPVDALPLFIENSWEKIRSDKDINLVRLKQSQPSQKELISNLRCCEIKNEAIQSKKDILSSLKKKCKSHYFSQFGSVAQQIIADALDYYHNNARHYSDNIFVEVEGILKKELLDRLHNIFHDQMLILDKQVYDQWRNKIKSFVKQERVSTHFHLRVSTVIQEIVQNFQNRAEMLQVKGAEWHIEDILENVQGKLEDYAKTLKETELQKLQSLTKGKIEKELGDCVHDLMIKLDLNFWRTLNSEYMSTVSKLVANVEKIMIQGFMMDREEAKERLEGIELEGYLALKRKLLRICDDLNSILRERFSSLFKYNERGGTRDWKAMDQEQIEGLFIEKKNFLLKCLGQFACFKIFPGSAINPRLSRGFSVEGEDGVLLETRHLDRIRVRFEEDVEMIYDQALNKHSGRGGGKVPWYFWLVAAFFGYEKVLSWMFSPIFLYPIVLAGGCMAVLHSVGLSGVVLSALRLMVNRAFRRINLNLHI